MHQIIKLASVSMALLLSSCVAFTLDHVTNNPVGTKVSVTKVGMFSRKSDFSYSGAAKKGNIQKIGTTQTKFGGLSTKMIVTGE